MPDTGIDLLGYWKSEAQAAFDQATRQYKIRIGNRSAWSRFHGQLNLSLGRMTRLTGRELPYTGVREHVEVELRNLEGHLRVLADGPELLVRSGSHTALDRARNSSSTVTYYCLAGLVTPPMRDAVRRRPRESHAAQPGTCMPFRAGHILMLGQCTRLICHMTMCRLSSSSLKIITTTTTS